MESIKQKFLNEEIDLQGLIQEFTSGYLDGEWIVRHASQFSHSNKLYRDIVQQIHKKDSPDLLSRLHFKDINFDVVDYDNGDTPQEWDFREIMYGPYRMVLFVYFNNEWWLGCAYDGLRTYAQVLAEPDFRGLTCDTTKALRPKFLNV